MTQAIWIDAGFPLNATKLRQHNITAPYFAHTDTSITSAYLDDVRDAGFTPGIYTAWNWVPQMDGPAYARYLDAELKRIGWKGNAPVCVDIETHDLNYIQAFFREWRRLRPRRVTAWTFEGFQGGLFPPNLITELVSHKLRFAPQFYQGDMTPHDHSPVLDLLIAGFPGDRLDGMYDAARLPYRWRGWAFTQNRLP